MADDRGMTVRDLLVCPVCHDRLDLIGTEEDIDVSCGTCGRSYSCRDGVHDMTPLPVPDPEVEKELIMWQQLQDNAVVAYDANPEANLSVGKRRDARLFAEFSMLMGMTLDIGCGPQAAPSYAMDFGGRLVGIDPLPGVQHREFDYVRGLGEYLPFEDETFDRVLFATSLDHMLVPEQVLREARRVLKHDGLVSIWFAEHHRSHDSGPTWKSHLRTAAALVKDRDFKDLAQRASFKLGISRSQSTPEYMTTLEVPEGAEDHFHAYHLDEETVRGWLAGEGFTGIEFSENDDVGRFVRASR